MVSSGVITSYSIHYTKLYEYENRTNGIYKKLFISEDNTSLLGGILVGDAEDYNMLFQLYKNKVKLPEKLDGLVFWGTGGGIEFNVLDLADEAVICSCENSYNFV